MAQRRCIERRFLLRPDSITTRIFLYVLAYAARKTGVQIHEFVAMSNHYHLVFTDPLGHRPLFFQHLDSLVARATNAAFGRWECFWAPGSYCAPVLLEASDIVAKCVYTLNNPVAAGLVSAPHRWEGATSWAMEYGRPVSVRRPEVFFSETMPEELELELVRPPDCMPELDERAARAAMRDLAASAARTTLNAFRRAGGSIMGMKRVLSQPRESSPSTRAPRRGIRPVLAGRSKWARIEGLQRHAAFLQDYAAALRKFLDGAHDTVFPIGTYLMRVRLGVAISLN